MNLFKTLKKFFKKNFLKKKFFYFKILNNLEKTFSKKIFLKKYNFIYKNRKESDNLTNIIKKSKKNLIDLCSGYNKNNISIILNKKKFFLTNIERSKKTLKLIKKFLKIKKREKFLFKIKKKNLFKNLKKKKYDIIISNPPYISYKNMNLKNKKLKFEPIESLTDFNKGIIYYKKIIFNINKILIKGYIYFEYNKNYLKYIKYIIKKNFINLKNTYLDKFKKIRFLKLKLN